PPSRNMASHVGPFALGPIAPRNPVDHHRGITMFSKLCFSVALFVIALAPASNVRADAPTKDEVVAQVKKAVEFYKANGREKALAELNNKDGMFAKGE